MKFIASRGTMVAALALFLGACSQGGSIQSPGSTFVGDLPGGTGGTSAAVGHLGVAAAGTTGDACLEETVAPLSRSQSPGPDPWN